MMSRKSCNKTILKKIVHYSAMHCVNLSRITLRLFALFTIKSVEKLTPSILAFIKREFALIYKERAITLNTLQAPWNAFLTGGAENNKETKKQKQI